MARLLQEFESRVKDYQNVDQKNDHHEKGLSMQKTFQSHVKNLVNVVTEMGNPFLDDCPELLALDTCSAQMSLLCLLCIKSKNLDYVNTRSK